MSKNDFHKKPGLPLYLQIKDHLLGKIDSGFWQEGEMVPTEAELCEAYKVSKITIREAVKLLVKDGKLKRTPGKGTFVIKNKLEQKLNRFFSFTRWAEQNGLRPASRILKVENMACDAQIAEHLSIRRGQAVTRIERLRIGGEEPLMLEVIWIPAALCPGIHLKDISNLPLNDILEKEYDITLVRATESIEPQTADKYTARLLSIDEDVLLLHVEHTAFDNRKRKVYFVSSSYRGDRVKFSIELTST